MTVTQQAFSAEIGIFPFNQNRHIFTCMTFRDRFTKAMRDDLICAGLSAVAQLEDSEKTAEEHELFDIEISKQGLAKCPWDGPPYLALICSHSALPLTSEYSFAEQIARNLKAIHDHEYALMDVPRVLFQALERLPLVHIVRSVIPPVSLN